MKATTASMDTHLALEETTLTSCWRIKRTDNVEIFLTEHDEDLLFEGNNYISAQGFNRSEIANSQELSVDNLDVQGILDSSVITEQQLRAGKYDFAEVRIFLVNWQDLTIGDIKLRKGHLGEVSLSDTGIFFAELRGLTQQYSQRIGDVYQPECRVDLGDAKCGFNLSTITVSTTIATVTSNKIFTVVAGTDVDDFLNNGAIEWTSGNNLGVVLEIKDWILSTKTIEVFLPAPFVVTIGDGVDYYPGCDKKSTTCFTKFNNIINFRGEPFVPDEGAVLRYPDAR